MTTNTIKSKSPDFQAFSVKKVGATDSIWTKIGAAWYHENNTGLNIELDCIPLDGRIVLRAPLPKEDQA